MLSATLPHISHQTKIAPSPQLPDMKRVATIILGGGQGKRLFPLTMTCCKPALSFGGRYRLIDIPISNAINSGCQKIFIITQFLSSILHQHIFSTYRFGSFSSGFIELLPSEERTKDKVWFQGTADAVRQNLEYFAETPADYFLILSGDQLYRMDYREMLLTALNTDADAVISALSIEEAKAKRMGVLQTNEDNYITAFHEKPQFATELESFRLMSGNAKKPYLGSMGIYLFKRQALLDLLSEDPREDFGKHLIPTQVKKGKVAAHVHEKYWEDIGTISSFYEANMALTERHPQFDCNHEDWRIYSSQAFLPGPRVYSTHVDGSILCEGAVLEGKEVMRSIIGPRTIVRPGAVIRNTYVLGNDFFSPPFAGSLLPSTFQIGVETVIDKAIIDKHVSIGNRVQLINRQKLDTYDGDNIYIRDGIIIVTRGATIPDGFIL